MATLHNPIAILLSHLQALFDVIILTFIIAMSLFLGGVRMAGNEVDVAVALRPRATTRKSDLYEARGV